MCISDEPGFYKDGEFGIRIEDTLLVAPHPKLENSLMFENLTPAPYCRSLIDLNLLPQDTIAYIDKHHQTCLKLLTPLLQDDPRALRYLQR